MIKVNNKKLLYAKGTAGISVIDSDDYDYGQLIPYRVYVGNKLVYPQKEVIDLNYRLVVEMDYTYYRLVDEYTSFGGEPLFPTGKRYKIYDHVSKIKWTIETAYPLYVEKITSFEPWEFMTEDGHYPRYDVKEALAVAFPVTAQFKYGDERDLITDPVLGSYSDSIALTREEGSYFITIERIDVENGESTKRKQVIFDTPSVGRSYRFLSSSEQESITKCFPKEFTDIFKVNSTEWSSRTLTEDAKYYSHSQVSTPRTNRMFISFHSDEGTFKLYQYDGTITYNNGTPGGDMNRKLIHELKPDGKTYTVDNTEHSYLIEGVGTYSTKTFARYCDVSRSNIKVGDSLVTPDNRIDSRIEGASSFARRTNVSSTYMQPGLSNTNNGYSLSKIDALMNQYHGDDPNYRIVSPRDDGNSPPLCQPLPVNGGIEPVLATSIVSNIQYTDESGLHYQFASTGSIVDFFYSIYKGTMTTISGNPIVGSSGGSEWEAEYSIIENTNPSYGSYAEWKADVSQLRTRPKK